MEKSARFVLWGGLGNSNKIFNKRYSYSYKLIVVCQCSAKYERPVCRLKLDRPCRRGYKGIRAFFPHSKKVKNILPAWS